MRDGIVMNFFWITKSVDSYLPDLSNLVY